MGDVRQLSERAEELGVQPEVHLPEGYIFLRDLPNGIQENVDFQQLVADCSANNAMVSDTLRTVL